MDDDIPADQRYRSDDRIMQGVIPYLSLTGKAGEAADFYAEAFAAKDIGRVPIKDKPGQFIHLQIEISGGALMLSDHTDGAPRSGPPLTYGHLQLVVPNGQQCFDRAVSAGCEVVAPFGRQPWSEGGQTWGDDWGMVRDPFGILWVVLTPNPALLAKGA
jgi:PhnB protein